MQGHLKDTDEGLVLPYEFGLGIRHLRWVERYGGERGLNRISDIDLGVKQNLEEEIEHPHEDGNHDDRSNDAVFPLRIKEGPETHLLSGDSGLDMGAMKGKYMGDNQIADKGEDQDQKEKECLIVFWNKPYNAST